VKTVWKYRLPEPGHSSYIPMPPGATIVHVALQGAWVYMWAIADPTKIADQVRRFAVVPTGQEVPESATYLGTVHDQGFVWHAFEITE